MQIVARTQPMSTDPDPPSPTDIRQALAATLRERAGAVDAAGPAHEAALVRTFTNPSLHALEQEERLYADRIAELAAGVIFGTSSRDRLTPRIAADLEQAATYLTRRIHPEFVKAAHEQAVDTLLKSEDSKRAFAGLSPAEARMRAHWLVTVVWGAFIGTLEQTTPIKPAVYLRCAAAATERGAR